MKYDSDRAADVRSMLSYAEFASDVPDERKRSIICSRVAGEVARLMPSGRPTISRTSVQIITGSRMVQWRIKPDYSLMVSVPIPRSFLAPSTRALTRT